MGNTECDMFGSRWVPQPSEQGLNGCHVDLVGFVGNTGIQSLVNAFPYSLLNTSKLKKKWKEPTGVQPELLGNVIPRTQSKGNKP